MPTSERWRRVQDLYQRVQSCAPGDRAALLDDECSGDEELRREVESLLCYASEADRFMEARETVGAETQAPDLLVEGQELGSYKILSMLGAGGMGKVYLAKDTRLGRTVAIKVLERAKVADAERKRRFMQEARSASALNHPNIVTVYDIASDSGTDFLVMEYVEGQTLHRRIPPKGLSIKESIGYAKQIVSALATAHAAGIVHRDIKPANVMVADKGTIKILDFGLAKLAEADQSEMESPTDVGRTREGVIIGTASYMSPEQAAGKRVDARSDIFAVGVVLYEMLTGRRAFDRGTVLATLGAVMYEEPAPVSQIVKAAPQELVRVIDRCLRKDPDRRIQTMADLRVALEELQDAPSTITTSEPVVKRRRPWLWWAVAGAIAAAAVAIYALRPDEQPSTALSDLQLRRLTDVDGWEVLPGWNSDGTMIAFGNNKDGSMDLFIMPVASGDPQQITQTPWDEVAPRWSPDFKYLAFVADRGLGSRLYVMPALGGPERELADSGILSPDHFAGSLGVLGSMPWSQDSAWLLYTQVSEGGRTAIWRINPNDRTKSQVTRPGAGESDSAAAWSFDGTRIAFVRNTQDQGSSVWIARPDGSDAKLLAKNVALGGPSWSADSRKILFSSQNQVWEVEVDSPEKLRRITNSTSQDWFPVVSARGRLAYVNFNDHRVDLYKARFRAPSNQHELFTQDTSENFFPSFSNNGQSVIYQTNRTGNQEIYLRRVDGTGERNLTENPGEDLVPSFAPDGSDEIVFVSNRDGGKAKVHLMGGGGESPRLLTSRLVPAPGIGGWSNGAIAPHWSPDGKKIGFIAIADNGESALFVIDRDGRNEKYLVDRVSNFDWYRDDRHIILSRKGKDGLTQVVGLDLETRQETLLIPTPALEPAVSRDGRNLLYTKAESHFNMNIWVLPLRPDSKGMPVPAGSPMQVTDGRSRWHAHKGAWSPDGQTIIYTRDSDQGDIYTIENYR